MCWKRHYILIKKSLRNRGLDESLIHFLQICTTDGHDGKLDKEVSSAFLTVNHMSNHFTRTTTIPLSLQDPVRVVPDRPAGGVIQRHLVDEEVCRGRHLEGDHRLGLVAPLLHHRLQLLHQGGNGRFCKRENTSWL